MNAHELLVPPGTTLRCQKCGTTYTSETNTGLRSCRGGCGACVDARPSVAELPTLSAFSFEQWNTMLGPVTRPCAAKMHGWCDVRECEAARKAAWEAFVGPGNRPLHKRIR